MWKKIVALALGVLLLAQPTVNANAKTKAASLNVSLDEMDADGNVTIYVSEKTKTPVYLYDTKGNRIAKFHKNKNYAPEKKKRITEVKGIYRHQRELVKKYGKAQKGFIWGTDGNLQSIDDENDMGILAHIPEKRALAILNGANPTSSEYEVVFKIEVQSILRYWVCTVNVPKNTKVQAKTKGAESIKFNISHKEALDETD